MKPTLLLSALAAMSAVAAATPTPIPTDAVALPADPQLSTSPPTDIEALNDTGPAVTSAQSSSPIACLLFRAAFPGKVFLPGTSTYTLENLNYWSATNYATPSCVFIPTTAREVAKAVRLARKLKTPLAVRGAGHLAAPNTSSVDGGILLAFTKFTEMELIKNNTSVLVGPGLRWNRVYDYLEPHGLVVVGGRIAPVGVPGLLLNGGVSFYNSQYGWACDNVLNFEVVTPTGDIVNANAAEHSDLFWALKGGSSNFGIVTRFELKTHKSRKIWGGVHVVSEDHLEEYKAAVVKYAREGSLDPKSATAPGFMSAAPGVYVGGAILFYDSETEEYPEALKMFTDIPSISSTLGFKTMGELAAELAQFAGTRNGDRQTFAVGSTLGTPEALDIIADRFLGGIPDLRTNAPSVSGTTSITIQTITRAMLEASERTGGNTFGLDKEKAPYFVHAHSIQWQNARDDSAVYGHINGNLDHMEQATKEIGMYEPFKYLGDAMYGQKVIESYGKENVQRMKQIQRKYDPQGVWDRVLPGGFKLPKDEPSHGHPKPGHGSCKVRTPVPHAEKPVA